MFCKYISKLFDESFLEATESGLTQREDMVESG